MGQPAFFDEVNAVLKTEPLADLKTYLRWHLVRSVANTLPTPYAEAAMALLGKHRFENVMTSGASGRSTRASSRNTATGWVR